ncbi:hypothetical protein V5O48_004200 [Marasmius crinis-equi]|uniref:Terpenoid synthase n=1 Tax=Marasmius crinis-equi TaxID=585013 RepID=A0ABR3FQY1_9AGAR
MSFKPSSKVLKLSSTKHSLRLHSINLNMTQTYHSDITSNPTSTADLALIKRIANNLLERCAIPYAVIPFDQELYDISKEVLSSDFLLPSSVYPWFSKYLSVGVIIATTSYSHIPYRARVHVATYTGCATALDDVFKTNPEHMGGFNERFIKGLPQDDPILEAFAKILLETSKYYGRTQSALIVTSTLDFVTSLSIDLEIPRVTDVSEFSSFAAYCRSLSGVSVAYAMFIFTEDVPLATYLPCLTHMSTYINSMNDVLSFYKEELDAEEDNFASMLAKGASITRYEAVQRLADDVADADERILKALEEHQPALDGWKSFRSGYVYFHTSCPRYKLDEVFGELYA